MLSGLSSLLFGTSGSGTDDAAVDQTQASQPVVHLQTQEADNDWLLVDLQADAQNVSQDTTELLVEQHVVPDLQPEAESMEEHEEVENHPVPVQACHHGVQPGAHRAAQGLSTGEAEQRKVARAVQRQQQTKARKQLSKKHLEAANKAYLVQSCGRKSSSSARSRVLRPSGNMSGPHFQRKK